MRLRYHEGEKMQIERYMRDAIPVALKHGSGVPSKRSANSIEIHYRIHEGDLEGVLSPTVGHHGGRPSVNKAETSQFNAQLEWEIPVLWRV